MRRSAIRSTSRRAVAAAAATVVAAAVLATVVTSDAGGRPIAARSAAHRTAAAGPGHSPGTAPLGLRSGGSHGSGAPGDDPSPRETSVPDPGLPAPLVSMDIAHGSDAGAHAVDITIDDGPDPVWTPKVLKVLHDNGVHAVFCMIGPQAAAHPDLVRRVVADGNRLCDHTVHHDTAMDLAPEAYQRSEIVDAGQMIERASGGVRPLYYRAPGGAFTPYSRQIAASLGMRPLGWNVDTKDFQRPGVQKILDTVYRELPNGPTILFHDGGGNRSQTVAALARLLPRLRHQGYAFGFPVR